MDGFRRNPKGTFATDIPQEIKMRDLLYSKKPVIKSTIGDVKITIQQSGNARASGKHRKRPDRFI